MESTLSKITKAKDMVVFLVKQNHASHHINYLGYRANHVVHGLCTLHSLGASKERILEYYQNHIQQLEPLGSPKFTVDATNWKSYIGNQHAYTELLPFFEKQISELGLGPTLTKFVPTLLPGFFGGLFHPLIHIAFGIEFGFPEVVAEGLAYACTFYSKVGEIIDRLPENDGGHFLTPLEAAETMKQINLKVPQEHKRMFQVEAIWDQHEAVVGKMISQWNLNVTTSAEIFEKLLELVRAVLAVTFGSYRNNAIDFFLMHNVTSLQAIRILLPHLDLVEQKRLLQVSLVGLLANMWLQGMPAFDMNRILDYGGSLDGISWETVKQKALACDDEHVAKVVRTLLVIQEQGGDSGKKEVSLRSALMTTDFIQDVLQWEFDGIGYPN